VFMPSENEREKARLYRKTTKLKARAKKGNAEAQNDLGTAYLFGRGVPKDYEEAVKWYRKAAEQEFVIAQFHLGLMYSNGNGVPEGYEDYEEAAKWYRKAAEQGLVHAQYNIGLYYNDGLGVIEDFAQSYAWLNIAVDNGHGKAKKAIKTVVRNMTRKQKAEAIDLSREMLKANPKLLTDWDYNKIPSRNVTLYEPPNKDKIWDTWRVYPLIFLFLILFLIPVMCGSN
jgi:TPR repeat protein